MNECMSVCFLFCFSTHYCHVKEELSVIFKFNFQLKIVFNFKSLNDCVCVCTKFKNTHIFDNMRLI